MRDFVAREPGALQSRAEFCRDGAALVAGLLFPLAFAPFEIGALAYVSLGTLFWTWQNASPARGALTKVAPGFTVTVLRAEFQPMQGITPYMLVGDYLILGFCAMSLLVVYTQQNRRVFEPGFAPGDG